MGAQVDNQGVQNTRGEIRLVSGVRSPGWEVRERGRKFNMLMGLARKAGRATAFCHINHIATNPFTPLQNPLRNLFRARILASSSVGKRCDDYIPVLVPFLKNKYAIPSRGRYDFKNFKNGTNQSPSGLGSESGREEWDLSPRQWLVEPKI